MKKIIALVAAVVMLVAAVPMTAAADNNSDIITAIQEVMPKEYEHIWLAHAQNILKQISVSDSQKTELLTILKDTDAKIDFTKGHSIDKYTKSEQEFIMTQFDKACDVLKITYTIDVKKNAVNAQDIVCTVYDAKGNKLGVLDGDITPDKTDVVETGADFTYLYVSLAVLVLAGAAFVFCRKQVSK